MGVKLRPPHHYASELERLRDAREYVAELVLWDPVYAPIFERLEKEIEIEEALQSKDVLARARAVVASRQMASL